MIEANDPHGLFREINGAAKIGQRSAGVPAHGQRLSDAAASHINAPLAEHVLNGVILSAGIFPCTRLKKTRTFWPVCLNTSAS